MRISDFFRDVLHASLANTRWSWGAENPNTGQLFLRVWVDERDIVDGVDQIHLLGSTWRRRSPGYPNASDKSRTCARVLKAMGFCVLRKTLTPAGRERSRRSTRTRS